jgi:hypothetical protein
MDPHIIEEYWDEVESILSLRLEVDRIADLQSIVEESIMAYRLVLAAKDCLDMIYHYDPVDTAESIRRSFVFWPLVSSQLISAGFDEQIVPHLVNEYKISVGKSGYVDFDEFFSKSPEVVASEIANFSSNVSPSITTSDSRYVGYNRSVSFDEAACLNYAAILSSAVLPRAEVFFAALAKHGQIVSDDLAEELQAKNTISLPSLLTIPLKRAAHKLQISLPYEQAYAPDGHTVWLAEPNIAQSFLSAIQAVMKTKGLKSIK